MASVSKRQGRCLCGAVSFTAERSGNNVGACHCGMCRRWSGGPLMAVDCGVDVAIDGEENLTVFDSSDWAERGFCNQCGSNLFYRLKETGQFMVLIGIFDNQDDIVFDHQVFIDEKPTYYEFKNKTKDLTGAELFAQFGA